MTSGHCAFVWTDVARGVAVLSMFVGNVGPGSGIILLSEFLTAALFAFWSWCR